MQFLEHSGRPVLYHSLLSPIVHSHHFMCSKLYACDCARLTGVRVLYQKCVCLPQKTQSLFSSWNDAAL